MAGSADFTTVGLGSVVWGAWQVAVKQSPLQGQELQVVAKKHEYRFTPPPTTPPQSFPTEVKSGVPALACMHYPSDAIGGGNGVLELSGAAVRLEKGPYPLAHAGGKLWELRTGVGDDVSDEVTGLVGDGHQNVQLLLNDAAHIPLQKKKWIVRHVRTSVVN